MDAKIKPKTLFNMSTNKLINTLLDNWYYGHDQLSVNGEHIIEVFSQYFPSIILDKMHSKLLDMHVRRILANNEGFSTKHELPSATSLLSFSILPQLRVLNLNCLRYAGDPNEDEIQNLHYILLSKIPLLYNLVELYLQTSNRDVTLPICGNEIIEKLGEFCPNLKIIDVSYNSIVTDKGLEYLIPSKYWQGCPCLEKIFIFECSVTSIGVSKLLAGLPNIKLLGYKEICLSLQIISKNNFETKLEHVNNLGTMSCTFKDFHKFQCTPKTVLMLKKMCPILNTLKIRVIDEHVSNLKVLKTVSVLELVYNVEYPTSVGAGTEEYLRVHGVHLVSLSLLSADFSTEYLKIICRDCENLQRFWIKCYNYFHVDDFFQVSCALKNLKLFSLTVGCKYKQDNTCNVPCSALKYVLHGNVVLQNLVIAMKSAQLNDEYICNLLSFVNVETLQYLSISTPDKNVTAASLNITMNSVERIVTECPNLLRLSNLLVWNVEFEDVKKFRKRLQSTNSALNLIYKIIIV
uniref:F-box domain-containing protein n=1 Tax=Clastoptera arizonana TaxID=38151 RepID=A0A1B6DMF7_9HEMI